MNIKDFKKKRKKKKVSILDKFKDDILELHNDNFSLISITEYLKSNGVNTSFQNVSRYIKKSKNSNNDAIKLKESIQEVVKTEEDKKIKTTTPRFQKIGKDLELKDAPSWVDN